MQYPWRLLCDLIWPQPSKFQNVFALYEIQSYQGTQYALPYKHIAVKALIRNNKFHHHYDSANTLASILDRHIGTYPEVQIVPIPNSHNRWRTRGYHHLHSILKHSQYAAYTKVDVLQKIRHTPQQSTVAKSTRLKQQAGTYRCNIPAANKLSGTVILFDDVVTTGATMKAALETLTPHVPPGTCIVCFALAH